MKLEFDRVTIASDETHHLLDNKPLYSKRFLNVLSFHPPGIAAVLDETGAYHIGLDGNPIYDCRYTHTFGFYNNRAAVAKNNDWFHILSTGKHLYKESYSWCGNFQNGACTVRNHLGYYFHIDLNGNPLYSQKYTYAGDFRDSIAVIQNEDGFYTHIYHSGKYVHNKWFHRQLKGLA